MGESAQLSFAPKSANQQILRLNNGRNSPKSEEIRPKFLRANLNCANSPGSPEKISTVLIIFSYSQFCLKIVPSHFLTDRKVKSTKKMYQSRQKFDNTQQNKNLFSYVDSTMDQTATKILNFQK
jgi:hypothetical protein